MTFEEQLKQIDHEIRKLKIQYDLFFIGSAPRPPNQQREALGETIKKLQFAKMRNAADRFLYNSLVNKFNTFTELWMKALRRKEEGTRIHPMAARAAQQAASSQQGKAPEAGAEQAEADMASTGPQPIPTAYKPAWRIPTKEGNEQNLKGLYDSYLAARAKAGDRRKVPYDAFAREITRQAAVLKGRVDCDAIEFRIYSDEKRVTIKARPAT